MEMGFRIPALSSLWSSSSTGSLQRKIWLDSIVNLVHGIAYQKLKRNMWESIEDYKRASAMQPVQAFKHTCLQVCWEGVLWPRTVSVEHGQGAGRHC